MAHTLGVDGIKTFVKKNGFFKKMWEKILGSGRQPKPLES